MTRFIANRLKRGVLSLVLVAGLPAVLVSDTACALASGPPHISVSGTPGTGVTVYGSNFTPSSWAMVDAFDWNTGTWHSSGWLRTSDPICFWFFNFCFGGGEFTWFDAATVTCPDSFDTHRYDWWSSQSAKIGDVYC